MAERAMVVRVFHLWAPSEEALESPEMCAFERRVSAAFDADPELVKTAMNAPVGRGLVIVDPDDGQRLFVLDGGKIYRPEDWDARGAPDVRDVRA